MHAWNRCLLKRANCSRLKSLSVVLDNLKASIVTTIEIILIIERIGKLDHVAQFFCSFTVHFIEHSKNCGFIFIHKKYFWTVFICSFPYLRNCKLKSDIVFAVNVILSLSTRTFVIRDVERLIKFQSSKLGPSQTSNST